MAHSYVLYPALIRLLASNKKLNKTHTDQPKVMVLMAVYNAEKIIAQKIQSVLNSDYPNHQIKFIIGSDCSTDQTDSLIQMAAQKDNRICFTRFNERTGKIGIINALFEQARQQPDFNNSIIISTDVTAIFHPQCISELVKCFADEQTGIVGCNIIKGEIRTDGISGQEKAYYKRELQMKYDEGVLWGCTMGVFGAAFAIRPHVFTLVPAHFLVDDFFISMAALQKGYKVMLDNEANVYMNVPNDSATEYRRKVRIAAGNFQNLMYFKSFLIGMNAVSFAYWSHKVIRWLGPFFISLCFISAALLINYDIMYKWAFYIQAALLVTPALNYLLQQINFHNSILRFASHFYTMNLGILIGYFRFVRGIKSSVWEPTKRV